MEVNARDTRDPEARDSGSLLALTSLALLVGGGTGFIAALFRLALQHADGLRGTLLTELHAWRVAGPLVASVGCAAATSLAAGLVRRLAPYASGSGIPHVEAALRRELPPAPFGLVPVKFAGGILSMGSGLALGREGPSVQMGASAGAFVARLLGRSWADYRVLIAAGAGAGLATAFNAPIAGAVFVLEELVQRFEQRTAIAALAASATAISVAHVLLGATPDFQVGALTTATIGTLPLYFALGAVAGLVAIAYNRSLLAAASAYERLAVPVEVRAGLIGAVVGLVAWFAPGLVGGGDAITQRALLGSDALALVPLVFVLRFALGVVSYAASTPGGLFAPLLVLGAQSGLLFGALCRAMLPGAPVQPEGFAVVGMAALFTAAVRAPITGIVLVTEMTGNVAMLLPMLGACSIAMLVPTLCGSAPIYESLRHRLLRGVAGLARDRR